MATAKASISDVNKKILWGKSGLKCAICNCSLLLDCDEKHIGEQAHIYGEKEGAARYDPSQPKSFVNSHKNLILLCANCHKLIDKEPIGEWTVEKLFQIKAEHEKKISDRIQAPSPRLIVKVIDIFYQALSDVHLEDGILPTTIRPSKDYLKTTENPQNQMKQEYADYLCEIYLKDTRSIDEFLANPNNAHTAKLLQDVARKINRKLHLENSGRLTATYFDQFCEETIQSHEELWGEKEETLNLMLFYLYWHCDIGIKE